MVSESDAPVSIIIRDIKGVQVLELNNQPANQELTIRSEMTTGIYFATVMQGNFARIIRLSKIN